MDNLVLHLIEYNLNKFARDIGIVFSSTRVKKKIFKLRPPPSSQMAPCVEYLPTFIINLSLNVAKYSIQGECRVSKVSDRSPVCVVHKRI